MAPFPKTESGEYSDLYEEVASKHYDIASVFGTPAPKPSTPLRRPRSDRPPTFETVVKKRRTFTRPGETQELRKEGEPITADNLFKPRTGATMSLKPKF
nr:hypothetical protein [Neorhizobium tomejilense]